MSKFFGFSSFYWGNFGFFFFCVFVFWGYWFWGWISCFNWIWSFFFFIGWWKEKQREFEILDFCVCVGVLVLVTNFYEFLVFLCWGWISWIWGWGRNVKFGVFLYFFYWVWIGYFFKNVIFFGWFNWIWVFIFLFGWWGSGGGAERVWNLVFCNWKGCECLISWPIGFEGFLNLWDNLSPVELHWFCKRMWLLGGFDWNKCSFSSRGRIEKKRELLKLLSFGPGWVANVWFGGELGLRLYEF